MPRNPTKNKAKLNQAREDHVLGPSPHNTKNISMLQEKGRDTKPLQKSPELLQGHTAAPQEKGKDIKPLQKSPELLQGQAAAPYEKGKDTNPLLKNLELLQGHTDTPLEIGGDHKAAVGGQFALQHAGQPQEGGGG